MIEQRNGKWCLIAKSTGETLGCHDTKEQAMAQETAIQISKVRLHSGSNPFIPLSAVEKLCAPCAEEMKSRNMKAVRLSELASKELARDPGFFTHCIEDIAPANPDITDPESFCAWLHQQVTGTWPGEHQSSESIQSADNIEIPFLGLGKTKNGDRITSEMLQDIVESYDPNAVHEAPFVIGPHDDDTLPAAGWIKDVKPKLINGEIWAVADVKPVDAAAAKTINKVISGPIKYNSPELDRLKKTVQATAYTKKGTEGWPGKAEGHWYLRRLNAVQIPAQFGMPQAAYADKKGTYIVLSGGTHMATEQTTALADMTCPMCGKSYAEDFKFCPMDGTALTSKQTTEAEKMAAQQTAAVAEATKAAENALAEQLKKRDEDIKKLSDALEIERKARLDERMVSREKEIRDQFARLAEQGKITPAMIKSGAIELAVKLAANDESTIKLADGKETSSYDAFLAIVKSAPVVLQPGTLKVMGRSDYGGDNDELIKKLSDQLSAENPTLTTDEVMRRAIGKAQKDPRWVKVG